MAHDGGSDIPVNKKDKGSPVSYDPPESREPPVCWGCGQPLHLCTCDPDMDPSDGDINAH